MLWCGRQDQRGTKLAKIIRLDREGRMIRRQVRQRSAPGRHDRRSGGQPLQTIAVIGADAGKITVSRVATQGQVTGFGMAKAMNHAAVDHQSDADAGAHGDIGDGLSPARGAEPPGLIGAYLVAQDKMKHPK